MIIKFKKLLLLLTLVSPHLIASENLECLYLDTDRDLISNYKILDITRSDIHFSRVEKLEFFVDGVGQFQLDIRQYSPGLFQSSEQFDDIILFPTINGEGALERAMARYLARRGFRVSILNIEDVISEDSSEFGLETSCKMEKMYVRIEQSAYILSEYLKRTNAKGKLHFLGASQGGIRSIIAAAAVKRTKNVWTNVAGGDFPSLYAYSSVAGIESFRRKHMLVLGLESVEEYETYLESRFVRDPVKSCRQIHDRGAANISMVIASDDTSVPTSNQLALKKACSPNFLRVVSGGHLRGVTDMYFLRRQILDFFEN